ncbi:hypothetical protein B0A66_16170 [Flavobacterium hercynium]|uniref:Uncharacterized protein n=1 Tax=Flavobacterium hercynium TaxID=387094 RepID=A0A226H206_9FLAO|nr:hypothetical protein B0A66_16170 [Flavobacterium hercynium]
MHEKQIKQQFDFITFSFPNRFSKPVRYLNKMIPKRLTIVDSGEISKTFNEIPNTFWKPFRINK